MKITYKGDYALKAILDLSYNYKEGIVVPLTDISKRQDIPEKYLEQIMLILKRAGFVSSKRGIGGGFYLQKPPKELTLGDIIRVIEGSVEPIACGVENYDCCGEEEKCAFREVWLKVTRAITDIVDTVTFEYMMKRTHELQQECDGYTYHI
jgi:Rrf2 family protein